jgi:hypothetical protein
MTIPTKTAYLIMALPDDKGVLKSHKYATTDFEEVFRFRKVCNQYKVQHAVRFQDVATTDDSYFVKEKPLHTRFYQGVKASVRDFLRG